MSWRNVLTQSEPRAAQLQTKQRFTDEQAKKALQKYQDDSELWNKFVAWLSEQADDGADADWLCDAFRTMETAWNQKQALSGKQGAFGANDVSTQSSTDEQSEDNNV